MIFKTPFRSVVAFVCLSAAVVAPGLARAQSNPISNPGFENGMSGWTQWISGAASVNVTNNSSKAHSGNYVAQLNSNNGAKPILVAINPASGDTNFAVTPGEVITFGGWAEQVSGNGDVEYVIGASDANHANTTYQVAGNASSGWNYQSASYTVPAGVAYVFFFAQIYGSTEASTALFDDVTFTISANAPASAPAPAAVVTPPATGNNLLSNPGFESGMADWSPWTTGAAAVNVINNASEAHSGNYVAQLTSNNGAKPIITTINPASGNTYFPVTPGETVTFGGAAEQVSGDGYVQYVIAVYDSNTNNLSYQTTGNATGGGWGYINGTYTVPAGAAYISFFAQIYGSTEPSEALFDDASLTISNNQTAASPAPAPAPAPASTSTSTSTSPSTSSLSSASTSISSSTSTSSNSSLSNPGFENGMPGWSPWTSGAATVNVINNAGEAHSGNYVAQLTANNGAKPILFAVNSSSNSTYFPVTPGEVITFGGWAEQVSGNGDVEYVIGASDSNQANTTYQVAGGAGAGWNYLSGTYTVPAGVAYVSFFAQIYGSTEASTALFDDASFTIGGGSSTTSISSCIAESFISGSVAPTTVVPGGTFTLSCNYGSAVANTGSVSTPSGCTWAGWSGNAAQFNCTAPATAQTYTMDCQLLNNSTNNFCAQTNPAGSVQVVNAATPTTSSSNYVGCYTDNSSRALPNMLAGSGATVESCIAAAQSNNYVYAGLQDGGQCFGGNTLGFTLSSNSNCNMPCTANSSESCGGPWYNSIYSTGVSAAAPPPAPAPAPAPAPVQNTGAAPADPNASTTTRAVYNYLVGLKNQSSHRLISGEWEGWASVDTAEVQNIQNMTGQRLGLVGADYYNFGNGITPSGVNSTMISYWEQGTLVDIDVHYPNPWTGGSCNDLTVGNFNDVITPGTAAYNNYMNNLTTIGQGLQQLQNAGVTVLFRPMMEMDGNWFWWGQKSGFAQLWIQTFNYLTNTMGLHNLLWVFAAGSGAPTAYYPGSQYVDVVGYDTYSYGDDGFGQVGAYSALVSTGKPFALAEFGLQSANYQSETDPPMDLNAAVNSIKQNMPAAVWFMSWSNANGASNNYWGIDSQLNASAALNNSWVQDSPVPY